MTPYPLTVSPARPRLDVAGIALSLLCIVHCLAIPLLATGALAWAASERVHLGLTIALCLVVVLAAVPGYRRHRRAVAPALLALGLVLLVAAVGGAADETALTVAGSGVLVAGHGLNLRLRPALA